MRHRLGTIHSWRATQLASNGPDGEDVGAAGGDRAKILDEKSKSHAQSTRRSSADNNRLGATRLCGRLLGPQQQQPQKQ